MLDLVILFLRCMKMLLMDTLIMFNDGLGCVCIFPGLSRLIYWINKFCFTHNEMEMIHCIDPKSTSILKNWEVLPNQIQLKNSARNHSENHVRIVIEPTIEQTNMMYTFIVHSANHYRIALSAMRKIDRPCIRASWTHRRILNPSQIVSRHQLNHRVHYSYTVPQWRTNDFLFYL